MKRVVTVLVLGLFALLGAQPGTVNAQTLLADYLGFDYEDPDLDPAVFGEVGSGYVGIGTIPGIYPPLTADTINNQYTYHLSGLTSTSRQVFGDFIVVMYTTGTISIYEDPIAGGTAGDYGINPPNGTAPSTFIDGDCILTGDLKNFQFIFNTVDGTGSYEGAIDFMGGSQFGGFPPGQNTGWTFAGATENALNIPEGYDHQIDGQVFLDPPVQVSESSWGKIKSLYR